MALTSTLVPPRRLGTLLRQARIGSGRELSDLTTTSGLTVVELDDIEHGRRPLDDALLDALVATYGIDDTGLVPQRSQLVIDLDEGLIAVNHVDVDVDVATGPDAILARYLALVYRLRELPIGARLHLRDVDIEVLSTALEIASGDVEGRLHRLMTNETEIRSDQRRIRRQLLLPLVGVLVAATGIGTLVLVAQPDDVSAPSPATVQTNIGNGGVILENPGR